MGHEHETNGLLASALQALIPAALLLAAIGYVALLARGRGHARAWPVRRSIAFLLGVASMCWALLGPLHEAVHPSFAGHMAQHLVVGMLGPYLMVLGAPMTLLLRRGPPACRAPVRRLLHTRFTRVVAHPVVALLLSVGTLPILYGMGGYAAIAASPLLHAVVHAHFIASGYLFAWVICGADPAPRRPPVPVRLVVLGVAVAVHAIVSQLLYAGVFEVPVDAADRRLGATLMYYGGDLIELALAVTLVTRWRPDRQARRVGRRRQTGSATA